ncbi:MAG: DUF3054 family protein [candidate division WOR-3 bacterium]
MNYQSSIRKREVLERGLELLAIFITIVIGFLSHKRNLISFEFIINVFAFFISWLVITLLIKPNFKNIFIISFYSASFGALIRAILLLDSEIKVSFILVFSISQTIMLYLIKVIQTILR